MGEWSYSAYNPHWIEVSGNFQALAALYPWKELLVHVGLENLVGPRAFWVLRLVGPEGIEPLFSHRLSRNVTLLTSSQL